jgi:thiamine-phosphate diphosphorylase
VILHLVTDRHRLAPGAEPDSAVRCVIEQARQAASAGIEVIQVRERDLDGRELLRLTTAIVAVTRGTATRVVVNARLDVALVAGADGVHLRGDSFDAARVRLVVPRGFLIGRSVRSVDDVRLAGPVDYLIAGTLWPTESKPGGPPLLGHEELSRMTAATTVPVLGIGGVGLAQVAQLARAGTAGAAAIGAWMGDSGVCRTVPLHDLARTFRVAFDAANMGEQFPLTHGPRQTGR